MYYFSETCYLTAIINFSFGVMVYLSGRDKKLNIIWFYFSFAAALWILGLGRMVSSVDYSEAIFWLRAVHYGGAIFLPSLYFHFTSELLEIADEKKQEIRYSYILSIILALSNLTGHFVTVSPKGIFNFYTDPNNLYHVYTLHFVIAISYSLFLMFRQYSHVNSLKKQQIKYQILATAIGFGGGGTSFFYVYNIDVFPFGVYLNFLYTVIMSYAIYRFKLLDIEIVLTKASVFLIVYSIVLGVPFAWALVGHQNLEYFLGEKWFLAPMFMLFILATTGPFLYFYIQNKIESKLLADQIRYQDTIQKASYSLSKVLDLRDLCDLIVTLIRKNIQVKHCEVFVRDEKHRKFRLIRSTSLELLTLQEIDLPEAIDKFWVDIQRPVLKEEVAFLKMDVEHTNEIMDLFQKLNAEIIIPGISTKDAKPYLSNFIAVGEKINSRLFSKGDVNTFAVLGLHSTIAIHNAINYAHEQEQRAKLFQTETLAKLGTMANSMGHQIKNYLQKIVMMAGADSGLSKEILNGAPDQKLLRDQLNDVVQTLEEITNQGRKAGDLITTFSNFSQLPNSDFAWLTIEKLLEDTKGILRFKIKMESLELESDIDPRIGSVWAHPIMVEAFLNLLDNAHDAMQERARIAGDNHEEYKPRVIFKAILEGDNDVIITIQDNGIGVKEEHLGRLFVPFYTTKATSAKGTGLGLYVIKEIIDQHKGTIQCLSEHMNGTTFILKIPKNFNAKKI